MKRLKLSRRGFLKTLCASGGLIGAGASGRAFTKNASQPMYQPVNASAPQMRGRSANGVIDRAALVKRHCPTLRKIDPPSPLSLGNGEFAFTADITGLQTFPRECEQTMPLCTMVQWGWHTAPPSPNLDTNAFRLTQYDTHGRAVGYATSAEGQSELYKWLRENPHRLHLGRIGLRLAPTVQEEVSAADIEEIEQRLDLWRGALTSRFKFEGRLVTVTTAVHPQLDLLAVKIDSSLISEGRLAVSFAFPYGSPNMGAADWTQTNKHRTTVINREANGVSLRRTLDADEYFVSIKWNGQASFAAEEPHAFLLTPAKQNSRLEFVAAFSPQVLSKPLPSAAATLATSEAHWEKFWTEGGAIELAENHDSRAPELERRIILSQYLTAIQCAGSLPPQETGLTANSWYGKFHLEMHWWHAARFALWNRLRLLERSLGWYASVLPSARERARSQGYAGARWAKMPATTGATALRRLDLCSSGSSRIRSSSPNFVIKLDATARRSNVIVKSSRRRRSSWRHTLFSTRRKDAMFPVRL